MITGEGRQVAFMYRGVPHDEWDSGWQFASGYESESYMEDPAYHEIYDVNTIANYDPDIVQFLDAPIGSAYEREEPGGKFRSIDFEPPE